MKFKYFYEKKYNKMCVQITDNNELHRTIYIKNIKCHASTFTKWDEAIGAHPRVWEEGELIDYKINKDLIYIV